LLQPPFVGYGLIGDSVEEHLSGGGGEQAT
jgi:hypothetical protein